MNEIDKSLEKLAKGKEQQSVIDRIYARHSVLTQAHSLMAATEGLKNLKHRQQNPVLEQPKPEQPDVVIEQPVQAAAIMATTEQLPNNYEVTVVDNEQARRVENARAEIMRVQQAAMSQAHEDLEYRRDVAA